MNSIENLMKKFQDENLDQLPSWIKYVLKNLTLISCISLVKSIIFFIFVHIFSEHILCYYQRVIHSVFTKKNISVIIVI